MSSLIVVPVRGLPESKTRLASMFASDQRLRLMDRLVCGLLQAMPAEIEVAVVTRNPHHVERLGAGVTVLEQAPESLGLNGALDQALTYAHDRGFADMLMLPGDVPLVQRSDIESLLLEEGSIVLVGDREQRGTNGLRVPTRLAGRFRFAMGDHSFDHHVLEARRHGFVPVTVYIAGLAHDLDTPDDWMTLPEAVRRDLLAHLTYAHRGA